jgi:hypothetical protein
VCLEDHLWKTHWREGAWQQQGCVLTSPDVGMHRGMDLVKPKPVSKAKKVSPQHCFQNFENNEWTVTWTLDTFKCSFSFKSVANVFSDLAALVNLRPNSRPDCWLIGPSRYVEKRIPCPRDFGQNYGPVKNFATIEDSGVMSILDS